MEAEQTHCRSVWQRLPAVHSPFSEQSESECAVDASTTRAGAPSACETPAVRLDVELAAEEH